MQQIVRKKQEEKVVNSDFLNLNSHYGSHYY